jgi:hypothetical protein
MNLRKIITILSIIFLFGGIIIILFDTVTAQPGYVISWQPLLNSSLPAFVIVILLLLNFKITGSTYLWLLITAVLILGIYSIVSTFVVPFAISLIAFIPMYFVNRQRTVKK